MNSRRLKVMACPPILMLVERTCAMLHAKYAVEPRVQRSVTRPHQPSVHWVGRTTRTSGCHHLRRAPEPSPAIHSPEPSAARPPKALGNSSRTRRVVAKEDRAPLE